MTRACIIWGVLRAGRAQALGLRPWLAALLLRPRRLRARLLMGTPDGRRDDAPNRTHPCHYGTGEAVERASLNRSSGLLRQGAMRCCPFTLWCNQTRASQGSRGKELIMSTFSALLQGLMSSDFAAVARAAFTWNWGG